MVNNEILNKVAPKGYGIVYGYYFYNILIYVGSTKTTIGKRAKTNGKGYVYSKYACKFGEFILLHGWENLEVRILAMPLLSELTKVEDEYIDKFDLINNGCNLYHACIDDDDTDEYTTKINGYKTNVYHDDNLRGDTRVGLIHDQTLKLNLDDKKVFEGYYISPCHGNSLVKNNLSYFDQNNKHTTVQKTLREYWLKDLSDKYNISLDKTKAEDIYDYRKEVILVNPVGRSYKKEPLIKFMAEHNL